MTTVCLDIKYSVASHVLRLANCVEHTVNEGVLCAMERARWFRPIYDEEQRKEAFYYNVLHDCERNSEKILETIHSKILFGFLNHSAIRESFIKFFFPDVEFGAGMTQLHFPNQRYMDLAIHGEEFFIIIENKINDAKEQKSQVGNYIDIAVNGYNYNINKVYVLYLDLENRNSPSSFSLSDNQKMELGNRLVCKSYKDDIMGWLTKVEQAFDFTDEPYLQRNLLVYKDYLEDKCNILNRHKNMNTQIDKILEEALCLDKLNLYEKIDKLGCELENVKKLQKRLEAIHLKYEFKKMLLEIEKKLSENGVCPNFDEDNNESIKFGFCYNNRLYNCLIGYDENGFYWGISIVNIKDKDDGDFDKLRVVIKNSGKGFKNHTKNQANWVMSNYASHGDIVERYVTLSEIIIEKTKVEPQRFSLV